MKAIVRKVFRYEFTDALGMLKNWVVLMLYGVSILAAVILLRLIYRYWDRIW